ncbi:hypothetical protein CRM22_007493 [Opisthorchis felineus]|uniref:Uncharacterized protein n=1 Tax=Opisthorchis felineus TaxID=147828 RepID=A0A4V6RGW2_OPIFE|nr:hypothetical protein CRM22_007493 [Opisthorchis felineus]TGZ62334.1 hypothetical protein CRM22_007493 [Opisthorchis felineus]
MEFRRFRRNIARITRRAFWRLPYLAPLAVLISVTFLIYLATVLSNTVSYSNHNYAASRIRDAEELRLARARTRLAEWRIDGRVLPFRYQSTIEGNRSYDPVKPPPGVTFAILAPNRGLHEIDDYEPSYLTESLVSLMSAIRHDLSRYGRRFSFVNITICPTTDQPAKFSELSSVVSLLPGDVVKRRLRPSLDHSSLMCRTVLDVASCLIQSVTLNTPDSYLVLLEDDMIIEERALDQFWKIFAMLEQRPSDTIHHTTATYNHRLPGLVQLHTPHSELHYSLVDSGSLLELAFLGTVLTVVLFIAYFHNWWRPFLVLHNCGLVCSLFLTSIFLVNMVGRAHWLITYHKLLKYQSITVAKDPLASSTGAAMLVSTQVARDLGEFLNTFSCTEIDRRDRVNKAQLIYQYLSSHNLPVWRTLPSLFKHRGLYSFYTKDVNPYDVE